MSHEYIIFIGSANPSLQFEYNDDYFHPNCRLDDSKMSFFNSWSVEPVINSSGGSIVHTKLGNKFSELYYVLSINHIPSDALSSCFCYTVTYQYNVFSYIHSDKLRNIFYVTTFSPKISNLYHFVNGLVNKTHNSK